MSDNGSRRPLVAGKAVDIMGLFDRFRGNATAPGGTRQIVGVSLKVRGGTNPLPAPLLGAFVTGYSLGDDPQEAIKRTVQAILAMGYDVEEIIPRAINIPLDGWAGYIASAWPDFLEHFPTQDGIGERLASRSVVFSPFAGFDQEARTP